MAQLDKFEHRVHKAVQKGNLPKLKKRLAESPGKANLKVDPGGWTPLHLAVTKGDVNIVSYLLEQKVEVNIRDDNGNTPLYLGIKGGHNSIVRKLLEHDADVDIPNSAGLTPLHCAAHSGSDSTVRLLVERGADISRKTKGGSTAADLADKQGHNAIRGYLEESLAMRMTVHRR